MSIDDRIIIGYCTYCKREIFEDNDYSVRSGNKYHSDCYELIKSDTFGIDLENYGETITE